MTQHDKHLEKLDAEMTDRLIDEIRMKIRVYISATESEKIKHLEAQIQKLVKEVKDLKAPQTERLFPDE